MSLKDFKKPKSKATTKSIGEAGICTIVNSKNGRRIVFSNEVIQKLGAEDKIQISLGKKGIAISKGDNDGFTLKQSGKKFIVYCGPLVKEITEEYKLVFGKDKGKVAVTFHSIEYFKDGDKKCGYIELV